MEEITKQTVLEKAKLCKTKGEFSRRFGGFYNYAKENNFLHEFYDDLQDTNTKYTLDSLQEEALKYNTRYQFKLEARNIYEAARRLKLLDTVCGHMIPLRMSFGQKLCESIFNKLFDIKGIYNDRSSIRPLELDIYYPSLKIAIEYQGTRWHNSPHALKNDEIKRIKCLTNNILLLYIHESNKSHENQIPYIKNQIIELLPNINTFLSTSFSKQNIDEIIVDTSKIYDSVSLHAVKKKIAEYTSLKDFSLLEPGIYNTIRKINRMDLLEHFRERKYPYKWRDMTDDEILFYIKDKFPTGILGREASAYVTILKRRKLTKKFKSLFK